MRTEKEIFLGQQKLDEREIVLPSGKYKSAAVVAIINPDEKILFMKRTPKYGGDWVFPGGSLDPGENHERAAVREVEEEVGIKLDSEEMFPYSSCITDPNSRRERHNVLIFAANLPDRQRPRIASKAEVADIDWIDPKEAIERSGSGEVKILPSALRVIKRTADYLLNKKQREYAGVLLGGTFDRLHKGHEDLLRRAFDVGDHVSIGVTTDEYVEGSRKGHKELIQPFDKRMEVLSNFLEEQGQLDRVVTIPLHEAMGSKIFDPRLGALIVSEETKQRGHEVNGLREKKGKKTVDILVVSMRHDEKGQISSTRLRQEERAQNSGGVIYSR